MYLTNDQKRHRANGPSCPRKGSYEEVEFLERFFCSAQKEFCMQLLSLHRFSPTKRRKYMRESISFLTKGSRHRHHHKTFNICLKINILSESIKFLFKSPCYYKLLIYQNNILYHEKTNEFMRLKGKDNFLINLH